MRDLSRYLFLSALLTVLASSLASAQSLAGSVRDTSGAVLPGVTVEAASPTLIEKVRTAVSDGNGQYQIANLPPGSYRITFALAGFATVVRDGVDLSGSGVTSINAELRVGALEESITVTGETPVVDVQSARQTTVIDGDVVRTLPVSRSYGNYLAAIPAIQATGFNNGVQSTRMNVGMDLYNLFNANPPTAYESVYDPASNGARWMRPTAVLTPRAARFNVQVDF